MIKKLIQGRFFWDVDIVRKQQGIKSYIKFWCLILLDEKRIYPKSNLLIN